MLLEARGLEAEAKAFYEKMLVLDETSIVSRCPLLSIQRMYSRLSFLERERELTFSSNRFVSKLAHRRLLSLPSLTTEQRIPLLLKYLDTFYTDIDAWVLLSELYASIELFVRTSLLPFDPSPSFSRAHLPSPSSLPSPSPPFLLLIPSFSLSPTRRPFSYTPSLASLSHTLILAPQNPLHYLRHAETAYTLGDLPLAFKSYLLCLSLTERVKDGSEGQGKGLAVRAWWGVKLVSLNEQRKGTR